MSSEHETKIYALPVRAKAPSPDAQAFMESVLSSMRKLVPNVWEEGFKERKPNRRWKETRREQHCKLRLVSSKEFTPAING